MTLQCGSQGQFSTILVEDSPGTFDVNSLRYDILGEDLGLIETQPGGNGLPGRLDPNVEHVRDGPRYARGRIMMHISPKELDNWLPWILRGTEAANVHSPGTLEPKRDIMVHRDDATFVYENCQCNSALFQSSTDINSDEPHLVMMMLDVVGTDEVSGTFPSPAPSVPNGDVLFWLAADSTLTIAGQAYPFHAFNLLINNHLTVLHRNSLTPSCIRSVYRDVRFQPRLPLSSTSATNLIFSKLDGNGSLAFDSTPNLGNGLSSTIFTFDRLRGPRRSPRVRGRSEIFHDLDLVAWAGVDETTTPVVTVTNTFPP